MITPLGTVLPGQNVTATATPPGTPLTGMITSAGGWPWVQLSVVSFQATVPDSFAGMHVSMFAGTYTVGGSGGSGTGTPPTLTWDMRATAGQWLAYQAITVGDVVKTAPLGVYSNNLHYAGTGTPELATFRIDTATAHDYDQNSLTSAVADAGLDESATEWKVPAGTGTITQGSFTAVFTPSNEVHEGITVDATVHEGHTFSYANHNYDEPVTKRWSETLTTFKVGVTLNPGDTTLWEDATAGELSVSLGTASMGDDIDWTGWTDLPGVLTGGGELPLKTASWKAVAASSGGQLTGIQKHIKYTPSLIAQGKYRISAYTAGTLPPFASNSPLVLKWLGKASSYVEAGIDILEAIPWGSLQSSAVAIGNSVIENEAAKEVGDQATGNVDMSSKTVDFSGLSIAGSTVTAGAGDLIHGSIVMKVALKVKDTWGLAEGTATSIQDQGAAASVKTTRPVYGN